MPDERTSELLAALLEQCFEAIDRGEPAPVEQLCAEHPHLADRLRARLRVFGEVEELLGLSGEQADDDFMVNEVIGRWRLGRQIGEGGFGVVFQAERTDGHDERAALKVLHRGSFSPDARARFRNEAQTLAMVRHPNIASILDSGLTASGVPYLAMELIEGEPVDRYCRRQGLDLRQRLAVLIDVCRAIDHAHSKGVLHRDLKPSNILVARIGQADVPKVIDFGIARVIEPDGIEQTRLTQAGEAVGTARYMSPEQLGVVESTPGVRSDVYSLGVILYELLTGRRLYDDGSGPPSSVFELQRRMRETVPRSILPAARTELGQTGRLPMRELDWIVMRCLEIDPDRRYAGSRELADDLLRLLRSEAVQAGPRSRVYITRKFVTRHRGAVAAAAVACIGLVATAIGTTSGLLWALQERDRAQRAEHQANRTLEFQLDRLRELDETIVGETIRREATELLVSSSAGDEAAAAQAAAWIFDRISATTLGTNVIQHSIMEPMLAMIRTRFADSPAEQGRLVRAIADAQFEMHLDDHAIANHRESYELLRDRLGPTHPETLLSQRSYAASLIVRSSSERQRGLDLAEDAAERLEQSLGPDSEDTLIARQAVASLLHSLGRTDESVALLRGTLARADRSLGARHSTSLGVRAALGAQLTASGAFAEAEPILREALEGTIEVHGGNSPRAVSAKERLAQAVARQPGREAESRTLYDEAIADAERIVGRVHPLTLRARGNRTTMLIAQGELDEAYRASEQELGVIESSTRDLGETPAFARLRRAIILNQLGRFAEAAEYAGDACAALAAIRGDLDPTVADWRLHYAAALEGDNRPREALHQLETAYTALDSSADDDWADRRRRAARHGLDLATFLHSVHGTDEWRDRVSVWAERAGR